MTLPNRVVMRPVSPGPGRLELAARPLHESLDDLIARLAQRHDRTFGPPGHGATHMGQRGRAGTGRQDEFLQARQLAVVVYAL